jgi:hypothetical protein
VINGWVVDEVTYWLEFFLDCSQIASVALLSGVWVSLSVSRFVLACRIYLESSVPIGCVVPRLMTHLSPGDGMIIEEGIMVHPFG